MIEHILDRYKKKGGKFHDPEGEGDVKWWRKQLTKIRTELIEGFEKEEKYSAAEFVEDYFDNYGNNNS